jgi:hypothetical protein
MSKNKTLYAWYSSSQDEECGHSVYLTSDGKEIKTNFVHSNYEEGCGSKYLRPDSIYVGEVTKYLRGSDKHKQKMQELSNILSMKDSLSFNTILLEHLKEKEDKAKSLWEEYISKGE